MSHSLWKSIPEDLFYCNKTEDYAVMLVGQYIGQYTHTEKFLTVHENFTLICAKGQQIILKEAENMIIFLPWAGSKSSGQPHPGKINPTTSCSVLFLTQ